MRRRKRSSDWNGVDSVVALTFLIVVMTVIFVDDIKVGSVELSFGLVLTVYGAICLVRRRFLQFPQVHEGGAALFLSAIVVVCGFFFL